MTSRGTPNGFRLETDRRVFEVSRSRVDRLTEILKKYDRDYTITPLF